MIAPTVAQAIQLMELAIRQNWRWYILERDRVYAAMMRAARV